MTCDKGCTPDWRVHSMHLTHLRCKNTTKCHSLKPETQRQGNRWDSSEGETFWLFSLGSVPLTALVPDATKVYLPPLNLFLCFCRCHSGPTKAAVVLFLIRQVLCLHLRGY